MAATSLSDPPEPVRVARFPQERYGDAQLVLDLAHGDRNALAIVWDRYARLVRGVLVGAMGPDNAVEDLMQDVFVALFKGAPRMQDGAALRGYLVGTAVRAAALELRKRKIRRWVGLSATGELDDVPSAPADVEGRESLHALYRVLDQLGPRRRMVFVLRHVQGLEMLEVAAALELSESSTRRELNRARQQLVALSQREPALRTYVDRLDSLGGSS